MSRVHNDQDRQSVRIFAARKQEGKKISLVTCYDAAFAQLVNESAVDAVLVGDSLGNVVLGYSDTTSVTMDHMVLFTSAVSRVLHRPLLIADMPFLSYRNVDLALEHAGRLVQEASAQCVKMEGGRTIVPQLAAVASAGIPVVGHLGLTPQHIHRFGGHRIQGRCPDDAEQLIDDAKSLEDAGASAIVLELIPGELARKLTESLHIPTIGIGAGPHCDGQVLVLHDLLGFDQSFSPKFLKRYSNLSRAVVDAVNEYDRDVKLGSFPSPEHSYH